MASGTIDGRYYDNIPTLEDWGRAQGELADLRTQLREAQEEGDRWLQQAAEFEEEARRLKMCEGWAKAAHERAEAAEAKLLQGSSVVFTGLSVPKSELDDARAELATQGDALRAGQEDAKAQRALAEEPCYCCREGDCDLGCKCNPVNAEAQSGQEGSDA